VNISCTLVFFRRLAYVDVALDVCIPRRQQHASGYFLSKAVDFGITQCCQRHLSCTQHSNGVVAAIAIRKLAHVAVMPKVKFAPLPDACHQRARGVDKQFCKLFQFLLTFIKLQTNLTELSF